MNQIAFLFHSVSDWITHLQQSQCATFIHIDPTHSI